MSNLRNIAYNSQNNMKEKEVLEPTYACSRELQENLNNPIQKNAEYS